MGDLEKILPSDLAKKALSPIGEEELVLPYAEALSAIKIATDHHIAILGLDAFEVRYDGLLTVDMADASCHVRFTGNWNVYVVTLNAEAESWIRLHRFGEKHGYILTSASESEFASLQSFKRANQSKR